MAAPKDVSDTSLLMLASNQIRDAEGFSGGSGESSGTKSEKFKPNGSPYSQNTDLSLMESTCQKP
jgi:hypothetical protein